ncbi:MAG: hypothetical protein RSD88_01620 [Anaerovoracaceae bacterium]
MKKKKDAKASLYIGNEELQLVSGTRSGNHINVESFDRVTLEPGTVINGVITDQVQFAQALNKLMNGQPGVVEQGVDFSVGSSQIITKTIKAPHLSKEDMWDWIPGEFTEIADENQEYIYDYRILKSYEDEDLILACAGEKSIIGNYVEIFEDMNIPVESIDVGLNCQIKIISFLEETKDGTFIFLGLDGNNLNASIFVDGVFKIYNRVRLINERGSSQVNTEIQGVVSKLIQFNRTLENSQELETVYFYGLRTDEKELAENIFNIFKLTPKIISDKENCITTDRAGFALSQYLYAVGNLIRN